MTIKKQTINSNLMNTEYIHNEIGKCETVEELKEQIIPVLDDLKDQWSEKIKGILIQNNETQESFGKLCGVSRASVNQWCHGKFPRQREIFKMIGLAAGYDADEISSLIQRYGCLQGLYSKNPEDLVCLFVLNNYEVGERVEKYNEISKRVKSLLKKKAITDVPDIETEKFKEKLSDVKDEDALEDFIQENKDAFATTYRKFYAYAKSYFDYNIKMGGSVLELSLAQNWSPSFTQCIYQIYNSTWIPTRNKIISLGLYMSMELDLINKMLKLAYMEPLCAKNIFDSVIIYILESASVTDILNQESDTFDPDGLVNYAYSVMEQIDLPEITSFMSEISLEDETEIWDGI